MKTQPSEPFLARIEELAQEEGRPASLLVPFDDFAVYYLLASEIARTAVDSCGNNYWIMVDAQTATQVDAVDSARAAAKEVYVFGPAPQAWSAADNLIACPQTEAGEGDLFLVVISPGLSLAIVCEQGEGAFRGAWTTQGSQATRIAQMLLAASGAKPSGGLSKLLESEEAEEKPLRCTMRLMALLTRQLTLRQRDTANDKDDLFSVLNVVKAISTERRAHDILFVFVQQIASAVHMDRCSVVRVSNGEDKGHVLASHEDESITDLVIDLAKYPEISRAMETGRKLIINDAQHDPITRECAQDLADANVSSIIVIPVVLFEQNVGSLLLRAARSNRTFSLREVSFCEIVAGAAANALERASLFESIQKANKRLAHLAITDGLTGLYNHRHFRDRLDGEFERARRYDLPLACMILDVDNFKKVNDTFGHLEGDSVLRQIAERTSRSVRKSDVVARYGGEEIVVIMPQTGLEGARSQAERVRTEIGEYDFDGLPNGYRVTVSIGVAIYDGEVMLDCEALIRIADDAMYRAKREGKNRIIVGKS